MTLSESIREKWSALSKGKRAIAKVLLILFLGSIIFLLGIEIGDALFRAYK